MQAADITYYQRVILWLMIGSHQAANLREASTYLRIIEKVRLTDQETRDSQFLQLESGQCSWRLPAPGYGDKCVELEDSEATALIAAIETASPVKVIDAAWMERLISALKNETHSAVQVG